MKDSTLPQSGHTRLKFWWVSVEVGKFPATHSKILWKAFPHINMELVPALKL